MGTRATPRPGRKGEEGETAHGFATYGSRWEGQLKGSWQDIIPGGISDDKVTALVPLWARDEASNHGHVIFSVPLFGWVSRGVSGRLRCVHLKACWTSHLGYGC
jgi:hypothetical protein